MSNGITTLLWPLAAFCVFTFAGCARDRASRTGMSGNHDYGSVAMAQQPAAENGSHVIQNKICPVMGEPLGAMGDPVPVTVGGETLFVCCQGCVKKVKADPAKYFAIARNE